MYALLIQINYNSVYFSFMSFRLCQKGISTEKKDSQSILMQNMATKINKVEFQLHIIL